MGATPHVAQNTSRPGGSAIDGRTNAIPGYAVSQRKRKLVEQAFGWMKTVGGLRKLRHRGGQLVDLDLHLHRGGLQHRAPAPIARSHDVTRARPVSQSASWSAVTAAPPHRMKRP